MTLLPFDADHLLDRLARRDRRVLDAPELHASAVLVPLFLRDGTPHLLFTKRSENLRHHTGQISFPGGRHEEGDADLLATALRETHEEIGLAPGDVRVLGALDDTQTLGRYRITPYLGLIPDPYPFTLAADEVDYLITVPVADFLDPARLRVERMPVGDGTTRRVYFYGMGAEVIWGATARIVHDWLEWLVEERAEAATAWFDNPGSDT